MSKTNILTKWRNRILFPFYALLIVLAFLSIGPIAIWLGDIEYSLPIMALCLIFGAAVYIGRDQDKQAEEERNRRERANYLPAQLAGEPQIFNRVIFDDPFERQCVDFINRVADHDTASAMCGPGCMEEIVEDAALIRRIFPARFDRKSDE